MIVRQFCARHGRSALPRSRPSTRALATEADSRGPLRSKTRDVKAPRTKIHAKDPSSTLDTSALAPTLSARSIEDKLNTLNSSAKSLEASLNAHISSRILSFPDPAPPTPSNTATISDSNVPLSSSSPIPSLAHIQSLLVPQQEPEPTSYATTADLLNHPPTPSQVTLPLLLANQTHLGHHTSLWHPGNSRYIFGIRDNIHIISLQTTFAHLQRAAKVTTAIARRGGLILFLGTRPFFPDIVVRAAQLASPAYHIFDRWVPGSLTNGQQILGNCALQVVDSLDRPIPSYTARLAAAQGQLAAMKPDLVICLNMLENEVCLHECGLHNVPTIGIVDTDVNPTWVTYPIPANDDSLRSVALIATVLGQAARQGQVERLETARKGVETVGDTERVMKVLERLEEVQETAEQSA